MDARRFKEVLETFADRVDYDKGQIIVEMGSDIFQAQMIFDQSSKLIIKEQDKTFEAREWLINRVANLSLLANRIVDYIIPEEYFILPKGSLLTEIEKDPEEKEIRINDTEATILEILNESIPFTSKILYITADAGEGKTTLINKIAVAQAQRYRMKQANWLLLPISLGGRTFLRFDDIIIGALANRFRFPMLYYNSFVELVRIGALVPAFDGFEEVIVEGATGEGATALGNLVRMLNSEGNIIISARKAYFEYKSFATQSKLFDSIADQSVVFSKLSLMRWDQENFLEYCSKRNQPNGQQIYDAIKNRFTGNHPLLTRAVLVRRLLNVVSSLGSVGDLLMKLGDRPHSYFSEFVKTIIEREVTEKWIDKSGEPARSLLSTEEHCNLLAMIAQEMWYYSVDSLQKNVIELIAEIFCEANKKDIDTLRQIKERISHHALLIKSADLPNNFAFDHDDFRCYFLGRAIANLIFTENISELKTMTSNRIMPEQTMDAAVFFCKDQLIDVAKIITYLLEVSKNESPASYVRENIGGLIVRLFDNTNGNNSKIENVTFPLNSLAERKLSNLLFYNCYFKKTKMENTHVEHAIFVGCTWENIEFSEQVEFCDVSFKSTTVNSITEKNDETTYSPYMINSLLELKGIKFEHVPTEEKPKQTETDMQLKLAEKVFRRFMRSTRISENVMKVKVGDRDKGVFFEKILPTLLENQILVKDQAKSDTQSFYRLNVPMDKITKLLEDSSGSFTKFVTLYKKQQQL